MTPRTAMLLPLPRLRRHLAPLTYVGNRFHADMDLLNVFMAEYQFPQSLKQSLRMYFINCKYVLMGRAPVR